MSKTLAVFGATGQQGGSVIAHVLNDAELSQQYQIRAITRDTDSPKARAFAKEVQVVYGDVQDRSSLATALQGVHTVFAMTTPAFGPDAFNEEYNNAKTIADVAVEKGASYIIFSTLPSVRDISHGKYTAVTPFDAKAEAEKYIRTLPIRSAFYCPGSFMGNFHEGPMKPRRLPDGTYDIRAHVSPKTQFPLIDAAGDSGKFVGAMLAEPDTYAGKTLSCATRLYSLEEIAAIISQATGTTVVYKQISNEDFRETVPYMFELFVEVLNYYEEFGYFGPESARLIEEAVQTVKCKLSTYKEYLEAHPLVLA